MNESKDNIFKKANKEIIKKRKEQILNSFILGFLLLSTSPLPGQNNEEINNIEISNALQIECDKDNIEQAKEIKKLLETFETNNDYGYYLLNTIKNNKTKLKITKESKSYYNNNTIYISNELLTTSKENILTILSHEMLHSIQDNKGIIEDINKLAPKEAIILNLLTELDATIKSYIINDNYYKKDTKRRANNSLKNMINTIKISMNNYISKAIDNNKNKMIYMQPKKALEIIQKLNEDEIFPELEYSNMMEEIYNTLPDKYKKEIEKLNANYIAKQNEMMKRKDIAKR